jgi:hypothetical protein
MSTPVRVGMCVSIEHVAARSPQRNMPTLLRDVGMAPGSTI